MREKHKSSLPWQQRYVSVKQAEGEQRRVGHSLKEWMDSGTVFPGFLCVVSPRSIPSRASAKTHTPGRAVFFFCDSRGRRSGDARAGAGSARDSPTDCPAVYESFLVRERLLPLVFAVRTTGEVCWFNARTQNVHGGHEEQHLHDYNVYIVPFLIFLCFFF